MKKQLEEEDNKMIKAAQQLNAKKSNEKDMQSLQDIKALDQIKHSGSSAQLQSIAEVQTSEEASPSEDQQNVQVDESS